MSVTHFWLLQIEFCHYKIMQTTVLSQLTPYCIVSLDYIPLVQPNLDALNLEKHYTSFFKDGNKAKHTCPLSAVIQYYNFTPVTSSNNLQEAYSLGLRVRIPPEAWMFVLCVVEE